MKIRLILPFCFLIGLSACDSSTDGASKMSEKDLYNFGLEAPADVYDYFKKNISESDLNEICEETKTFRVVSFSISVNEESVISECEIKAYDCLAETGKLRRIENSKTEKIFRNLLLNKKVYFSFIEKTLSPSYSFRLNISKFCK